MVDAIQAVLSWAEDVSVKMNHSSVAVGPHVSPIKLQAKPAAEVPWPRSPRWRRACGQAGQVLAFTA